MQVYNDQLGHHNTQIVELVMANTKLNREKDLRYKDMANLTAKGHEVELARDTTIKENVVVAEENLWLIIEKVELEK